MMRFFFFLFVLGSFPAFAQQTYTTDEDDTHYCGGFTLEQFRNGDFSDWFSQDDPDFVLPPASPEWAKKLKGTTVDIYIGTWCGDSKLWVPRFVKYWTAAGLSEDQLNFVALYNGTEKYKQGPSGEEKGKRIHRVPTFIFNRDGEEFSRIVEYPVTDLETDLAQIALGHPTRPSYPAANYLWNLLETQPIDSIYANGRAHSLKVYRLVGSSSELNTLGYVLLRAGEIDKAKTVFHFNTIVHRYNPNVYDSYGEVLAEVGENEQALKAYEKALAINPELESAIAQVEKLKKKIGEGADAGAKGVDDQN
jgi:tetratricopeptide (TPR) repeat protein